MRTLIAVLAVALLWCEPLAQTTKSPYAGEQKREIRSLSPEEIDAYLSGQGMGLAKAAELNQYPGPKHVIELAAQLGLTESQLARTKRIYEAMSRDAIRLGRRIVEKEKQLDRLFAEQRINDGRMSGIVVTIGLLQGQLRAAHLRAHLETRKVLSREQIDKYGQLRGYSAPGGKNPHRHDSNGL